MNSKNVIRERRLELGLTYEELGKMVGVGKSTVRKWETGMIENIKRDNIVALAKALKISPAIIMGWDITDSENIHKKLTEKETILLENYNKLNDLGKKEADKRVFELTEISRYIKNTDNETLATKEFSGGMAAHNDDAEDEEQQSLMEEDLKNL